MTKLSPAHSFLRRYGVVSAILALLLAASVIEPTSSDSPFALLTTTCTTLTSGTSAVLSGSSDTIRFGCGANPALTVARSGFARPLFNLPEGYTTLTMMAYFPGGTSCSPGTPLVSSAVFNFVSTGSFDYCALYSNVPAIGLASFNLIWTKAVPKGAGA